MGIEGGMWALKGDVHGRVLKEGSEGGMWVLKEGCGY